MCSGELMERGIPERPAQPGHPQKTPTLEPWMRQTMVLKLKEVEGRVPDMTAETFCKKMILDQGFSKAETLSVQNYLKGIWYITFASIAICKRYWEAVKTARPESSFSRFVGNCPIQREERRVMVSMRNPHTPGKDIATFLSRFCSVVKDRSKILDVNGFWTGKWSIIIRLRKDNTTTDGLQHLPSSFALGGSAGLLHYADQPRNCRKCGEADHMARSCKVSACRNCKVAGHETKDCPRKLSCNLCGLASHIYRDCPHRARTYAAAARIGLPESGPAPALQPKPAQRKQQKPTPQPRAGKISPTPVVMRTNKGGSGDSDSSKKKAIELEEDPLPSEGVLVEMVDELLDSEQEEEEFLQLPHICLFDQLEEKGLLPPEGDTGRPDQVPPDEEGT
ncbi:uncharacterized protein LOC142150816 [Mixophyes fleayi]|uniref:uncharacterized protein LOC142150816 n=1 Tax=Mixophyes fleayi TaxID=3061075 RepID=UPI003F4D9148